MHANEIDAFVGWMRDEGLRCTALQYKGKRPTDSQWLVGKDWQEIRPFLEVPGNVGLLTGKLSNGLVDVDLDCPEAAAIAPSVLMSTGWLIGRRSNPRSHWFYRCRKVNKTKVYSDPITGKTLLELRSDGHQTMIPPSIHPSGEEVVWHRQAQIRENVEWSDLETACGRLAMASFLAAHWWDWTGSIHFLCLALSGIILGKDVGMSVEEAEGYIAAICQAAGEDRDGIRVQVSCVRSTAEKIEQGEPVTGWPRLSSIVGEENVIAMRGWLGLSGGTTHFEKSDSFNAQMLIDEYKELIRYNESENVWMLWDGKRWSRDMSGNAMVRYAMKIGILIQRNASRFFDAEGKASRTGKDMAEWGKQSRNYSRMHAMVKVSQSDERIKTLIGDYDSDRMSLNLLNGTLNLYTGELRPHDREELHTRIANVEYNPTATCPTFQKFIERILPNEDTRRYVQKVLGYCLTGLAIEEKFWICYGPKQNGKSTLMVTISEMMGEYAQQANKDSFLKGNRKAIRDDIAHMTGARLITTSEPEHGDVLDGSLLKDFIGGDKVRARHLYKGEFEFSPAGKIWINTNNLPKVNAFDGGIWRRLRAIPFNVTIPDAERNLHLKAQLLEEKPGILNWALEGLMLWHREGLNDCIEVVESTQRYQNENNSIAQFVEEKLIRTGEARDRIPRGVMFEAYRIWCKSVDMTPTSHTNFPFQLQALGFLSEEKGKSREWIGYKFRIPEGSMSLGLPGREITA